MVWPTTKKIYVLGSLASFPVATVISGVAGSIPGSDKKKKKGKKLVVANIEIQ